MRKLVCLLFIFSFTLTACGPDFQVKIESNTEWKAEFEGTTIDGEGNKMIDIPDEGNVCLTCTKKAKEGFVKVTLMDLSSDFFSSDVEIKSERTEFEYGSVTVCTNNN